jgi:hypothetical protein
MPFTQGIRKTSAWFDADPGRRLIDDEANALWDRLIASWAAAPPRRYVSSANQRTSID